MNGKHTPGPWKVASHGEKGTQQLPILANGKIIAAIRDNGSLSDAKLIAASPKAIETAGQTYFALLQMDICEWRIKNQAVYCALRDYIALATGRDEEEVQNDFESRAAIAKATE